MKKIILPMINTRHSGKANGVASSAYPESSINFRAPARLMALFLCAAMLFACSTTPKVIEVENGNERSLSCQQLAEQMQVAQQSKTDAHKDDSFTLANTFAYWWLYHMMKADSNATARLELLSKISQAKGCGM